MDENIAEKITRFRRDLLVASRSPVHTRSPEAAEGSCGVLGYAANVPVAGLHVLTASRQMHNRGNGKSGCTAMVGLDPAQVSVDAATLASLYLLQIAYLDPTARQEVEDTCTSPFFDVP